MLTNHDKKDQHQLMVEVFMALMHNDKQTVPVRPTVPSLEIRKLRASLMLEECLETIRLGLGLDVYSVKHHVIMDDFTFEDARKPSLIQLADGLGDCRVVNDGTGSAFGIALEPFYKIVMTNNLSKFAPGHSFNAMGKLIKPKDFVGPDYDIMRELQKQNASLDDFGPQDKSPE